jgi:hypothetical protein
LPAGGNASFLLVKVMVHVVRELLCRRRPPPRAVFGGFERFDQLVDFVVLGYAVPRFLLCHVVLHQRHVEAAFLRGRVPFGFALDTLK